MHNSRVSPPDIVINASKTIGTIQPLLVAVDPIHEFVDNRRSDKILGYMYQVVLPSAAYKSLSVKILDKPQLLQMPEDGTAISVVFQDLELFLYWRSGSIEVGAKAASVSVTTAKP